MPGINSAANNLAVTPFIVGQVLGAACNYTVIQEAIDACFAAGGGNVWIQNGTYNENLVMRNGVDVLAAGADGRLQNNVFINGSHTMTGSGQAAFSGIGLTSTGADLVTLSSTVAGQQILFVCKFCAISATGGHVAVTTTVPTAQAIFAIFECQGGSDLSCVDLGDSSIGVAILSDLTSSTAQAYNCNGASSFVQLTYSSIRGATDCISVNNATAGGQIYYSTLIADTGSTINFTAAGNVTANHNSHYANAGSGFYIEGAAGTYAYSDDTIMSSATAINPGITQSSGQWRPRSTAGINAAAAFAGTASFDSAQFTVTDGFVQATGSIPISFATDSGSATPVAGIINVLGGPGVTTSGAGNTVTVNSVVWTDHAAPVAVTANSGSFDTAGVTLTLPAAPVQGTECRVVSVVSPTVIQTSGTQFIQIGTGVSTPGGTCSGTNVGDTIVLVYFAASDAWYSVATNGNWVLA